jgi:mono/diheme cytochrome c family protein
MVMPSTTGSLAARWLLFAALGVLMGGCAFSAKESPFGTDAVAVARGQALAAQDCGGCHGLGLSGESAFAGAPPFRSLDFDYNAISAQRALAQDHSGRVGMPPPELTLEEVADIGAYVRSLKQAARR